MRFRNSSNVRVCIFFVWKINKKICCEKFNSSQLHEQAGVIAYGLIHFSAEKKYLQTVEKFNNYKIWYTNKISLILYIFFQTEVGSHIDRVKKIALPKPRCVEILNLRVRRVHIFLYHFINFNFSALFQAYLAPEKSKIIQWFFCTYFLMKFFIIIWTLRWKYFFSITERVYVLKSRSGCFCCNVKIELKFKYFSLIFSHIHRVVEKIHSK